MSNVFVVTGRVVGEPRTNQVGDKELTTIRIADNPVGEKAKKRYISMFVNCTFTGFDGDRAQTLQKGDVITVSGQLQLREYDPSASKKTKGGKGKAKKGSGEVKLDHDMPFARLENAPWRNDEESDEKEEAEGEEESEETEEPAADEFGLGDDDPLNVG